jgi:hypothetical protein
MNKVMENFENELIMMFVDGNDNYYGEGKKVEYLYEDIEYGDKDNYDGEFVNNWIDLKDRLKGGDIKIEMGFDNIVYNFELKGEDVLMWFIEGKKWD